MPVYVLQLIWFSGGFKKRITFLLKPKYVINVIFHVSLLLFVSCLYFFPHFLPLSLACSIKTRIPADRMCSSEPGILPPHLLIFPDLSVVSLRICYLSNTPFLQLFYCSETFRQRPFLLWMQNLAGNSSPHIVFLCGPWGSALGTRVQGTGEQAWGSLVNHVCADSDPGTLSGDHCGLWWVTSQLWTWLLRRTGGLLSGYLLPFSEVFASTWWSLMTVPPKCHRLVGLCRIVYGASSVWSAALCKGMVISVSTDVTFQ